MTVNENGNHPPSASKPSPPAVPSLSSGGDDRRSSARGLAWIVVGAALLTSMSALNKLVGGEINPFQLAFFRAVFGLALILPIALRRGGLEVFRTDLLRIHLIRGTISAIGVTATVFAVVRLSLASATAIAFTTPLFIVVLAGAFLGERVSPIRWLAAALGFVGVLIASPPTPEVGLAVGAALLGALAVSAAKLLVKNLAATDTAYTILIYLGLVMMAVTSIPTMLYWEPLDRQHLAALGAIGALSMGGQACAIQGYKVANASAIAPAEYSRLLWAIVLGWLLFGERPAITAVIGASIIIVSTILTTTIGRRGPKTGGAPLITTAGPSPLWRPPPEWAPPTWPVHNDVVVAAAAGSGRGRLRSPVPLPESGRSTQPA